MEIIQIKEMSSEDRSFYDAEWAVANIEHFGTYVIWSEQEFILKAVENDIILGLLEVSIQGGVAWVKDLIVEVSGVRVLERDWC